MKLHYTCQSLWCIYALTCTICMAQYTGQTTKTVQIRHYGHRSEIKRCAEGMGDHFYKHTTRWMTL